MSPPRRSIARRGPGSGYMVFATPLLRVAQGISAYEIGTKNSQNYDMVYASKVHLTFKQARFVRRLFAGGSSA